MKSCSIGATSCGQTSPNRPIVIAATYTNTNIQEPQSPTRAVLLASVTNNN